MKWIIAILAGFCLLLFAGDGYSAESERAAQVDVHRSATDVAELWQPPNVRRVHLLGGGDRQAYMRPSVKGPLSDVWRFYADKIGYQGDTDYSMNSGTLLTEDHIIISDHTRNIILLVHSTDEYSVTVRIPIQKSPIIEDILVTVGTR